MLKWHRIIILELLLICNANGQDSISSAILNPEERSILNLKIEEAKKQKVSVSSLTDLYLNETPGVVYVITADEIQARGYTDLIEVLQNIPGINIASDVQNGVGISMRGVWGGEAKVLYLIDGVIANELAYGSFVIGNRIPLTAIERLEVLKGAGSALYGNFAGIGVINIVTKGFESNSGSTFSSYSGISKNNFSDSRVTFDHNSKLLKDVNISIIGSFGFGNRSNDVLSPNNTYTVSYLDSSRTDNAFMKLHLNYKDFNYSVIFDDYTFQGTHEAVFSIQRNFSNKFSHKKKFRLGTLESNVTIIDQLPWVVQYGNPDIYASQNNKTRRYEGRVDFRSDIIKNFGFNIGLLGYRDYYKPFTSKYLLANNSDRLNINGFAQFLDLTYKTKIADFFAGYRLDKYFNYNILASTRFAITKEFRKFFYKIIAGNSIKIPTLQNINLGFLNPTPLKPEKIEDYQLELGLNLKTTNFKVNAYYTKIKNIITFTYDLSTLQEGYFNEGFLNITGIEAQFSQKLFKKLTYNLTVSKYVPIEADSRVYIVNEDNLEEGTFGNPVNKLTNSILFDINKWLSLYINSNYTSGRTAYELLDADSQYYDLYNYKPIHLIDVIANFKLPSNLFSTSFGIKNILDQKNVYAYPSNLGYPSIFGRGREVFLSLKVNL